MYTFLLYLHNYYMKTKYLINGNTLIIDLNYLNNLNQFNIRNNINIFLTNNKINFKGNKIIIYHKGLLIGTFYLINKYLKFLNNNKNYLTSNNSYFEKYKILEIKK